MRARGIQWMTALAALVAASGCARHTTAAPGTRAYSDAALQRGRQIYARECAACHGPQGAGTQIAPTPLRNIAARRTFGSVRAVVLDPRPPMPKLYPSRLTRGQVDDVSAYVENL